MAKDAQCVRLYLQPKGGKIDREAPIRVETGNGENFGMLMPITID